MKKNKLLKIIKNPKFILLKLDQMKIIRLSDKVFIKWCYEYKVGKKLNLDNPTNFNEKIQWLKLYDRKGLYTKLADKYEVKEYLENKIGKDYVIPLLGVWDSFDDIDFNKLPKKFVLKTTHDSGGIIIVKDKDKMDLKKMKKNLNKSLKRDYYRVWREWQYKNIHRRIIAEEYLENNGDLLDYKFFCFNGKPKICLVCSNRFKDLKETWYDDEWNKLNLIEGNHKNENFIEKPRSFKQMKDIATKLSNKIAFLRVDFYEVNKKPYVGEITFHPQGGYEQFKPEKWNKTFGDMIDLKITKGE